MPKILHIPNFLLTFVPQLERNITLTTLIFTIMTTINLMNGNEVMNVMNYVTNTFRKGCGTSITICKDVDMNKGRGADKNPYIGRLTKVETYGGWSIGTDYETSCNNSAERSGSDAEIETQSVWHTYYNDFFQTDKRTRSKFYLQIQKTESQGTKVDTTYYLDGKEISRESAVFKDAEHWFKVKKHNMPSTQIACGVNAQNERHYKLLSLDNITEIRQGDNVLRIVKETEKVAVAVAK